MHLVITHPPPHTLPHQIHTNHNMHLVITYPTTHTHTPNTKKILTTCTHTPTHTPKLHTAHACMHTHAHTCTHGLSVLNLLISELWHSKEIWAGISWLEYWGLYVGLCIGGCGCSGAISWQLQYWWINLQSTLKGESLYSSVLRSRTCQQIQFVVLTMFGALISFTNICIMQGICMLNCLAIFRAC